MRFILNDDIVSPECTSDKDLVVCASYCFTIGITCQGRRELVKVDIFNETMMGNAFDIYVNLLGLPSAPCELVCILKYTDCHFCCCLPMNRFPTNYLC